MGIKAKKVSIGNLNEIVTTGDIYEVFGLKSTAYLCQTGRVDLKMFGEKKPDKNQGFGFITIPEQASNHLMVNHLHCYYVFYGGVVDFDQCICC